MSNDCILWCVAQTHISHLEDIWIELLLLLLLLLGIVVPSELLKASAIPADASSGIV